MVNLNEVKELIENNPLGLATITADDKPNIIGVASVKVVANNQILITDNYMNRTLEDIAGNKNVCLIVWDSEMSGCKLIGEAEYFNDGKWKGYVEAMEENKGLPAKGAILITINKIILSK